MGRLTEDLRIIIRESGEDDELVGFALHVVTGLIEPAENAAPWRVRVLVARRIFEAMHTQELEASDIEAARAILQNIGLDK